MSIEIIAWVWKANTSPKTPHCPCAGADAGHKSTQFLSWFFLRTISVPIDAGTSAIADIPAGLLSDKEATMPIRITPKAVDRRPLHSWSQPGCATHLRTALHRWAPPRGTERAALTRNVVGDNRIGMEATKLRSVLLGLTDLMIDLNQEELAPYHL